MESITRHPEGKRPRGVLMRAMDAEHPLPSSGGGRERSADSPYYVASEDLFSIGLLARAMEYAVAPIPTPSPGKIPSPT